MLTLPGTVNLFVPYSLNTILLTFVVIRQLCPTKDITDISLGTNLQKKIKCALSDVPFGNKTGMCIC